jgi:hypothetical protein
MIKRVSLSLLALSVFASAAAFAILGSAGASTVRYSHTWSPPLNLPSNYRPCCPSTAGFTTLPFSMNVNGNQAFHLTVRMRTNWVDTKAVNATPNIIQQGLVSHPIEIKLSIHSGPHAWDHHAQCRIEGSNGVTVNAQGPKSIDIANGSWHTIVCYKSPDGPTGTSVQLAVDGVLGPVFHSAAIGNVISNDPVDLGGQGPKANQDSIDGQYTSVSYVVG